MRKMIAKRSLKDFSARYDYDVSYLTHMLDVSPSAFMKFTGVMELAQHRGAAPSDAMFAAAMVGALTEDCGPCVQLNVNMALEAGMSPQSIEAVLTRNQAAMNADTRLGFLFADALVRRALEENAARDAVQDEWGEPGVVDLTLAVQISRVFPMVKAGLGYAKTCQRVQVEDRPVDVVKPLEQAA